MSTPPRYSHPGNQEAVVEAGDGLVVGTDLDSLDYGHVIGIEYDDGGVIRVTFDGHARPVVGDAVESAVELALGPLWSLRGRGAGVYRLAPVE